MSVRTVIGPVHRWSRDALADRARLSCAQAGSETGWLLPCNPARFVSFKLQPPGTSLIDGRSIYSWDVRFRQHDRPDHPLHKRASSSLCLTRLILLIWLPGLNQTSKPIFKLYQIISHHHLTLARPAIGPSH